MLNTLLYLHPRAVVVAKERWDIGRDWIGRRSLQYPSQGAKLCNFSVEDCSYRLRAVRIMSWYSISRGTEIRAPVEVALVSATQAGSARFLTCTCRANLPCTKTHQMSRHLATEEDRRFCVPLADLEISKKVWATGRI